MNAMIPCYLKYYCRWSTRQKWWASTSSSNWM